MKDCPHQRPCNVHNAPLNPCLGVEPTTWAQHTVVSPACIDAYLQVPKLLTCILCICSSGTVLITDMHPQAHAACLMHCPTTSVQHLPGRRFWGMDPSVTSPRHRRCSPLLHQHAITQVSTAVLVQLLHRSSTLCVMSMHACGRACGILGCGCAGITLGCHVSINDVACMLMVMACHVPLTHSECYHCLIPSECRCSRRGLIILCLNLSRCMLPLTCVRNTSDTLLHCFALT